MNLYFYGADKEVTGSCHMLHINGKNILVDCGLQQGNDEKSNNLFPFAPKDIHCVLVTHAHIDHSGRLPLLFKNGYRGPVYATGPTCRLMNIMLMDSAHIQESDAKWKQRKEKRANQALDEPLYTTADAQIALENLHPCTYGEQIPLCDGAVAVFSEAGHLLGSSSITIDLTENSTKKRIVFSGDIGNKDQPILRDPLYLESADYIVMESTYGNRMHEKQNYTLADLARIIETTLKRGGNAVIPAFAVGRTQELLYHIREIKEQQLTSMDFPVYVDSPLALEATQIYDGDLSGYADEDTIKLLRSGFKPLQFSNLRLCRSTEESIALNENKDPKVIISASGMCDAGRVRHHLKHNLWRPESSIIFAGYQANGTLGRMLLDGIESVKLFREEIAVRAEIYNFRGLSAHADQAGLLQWLDAIPAPIQKVFVVHGEEAAAEELARLIRVRKLDAYVPNFRASFDLATGEVLDEGIQREAKKTAPAGTVRQASPAYTRLLNAGQYIMDVIGRNEGGANKDLAKFTDQLLALAEKWDR